MRGKNTNTPVTDAKDVSGRNGLTRTKRTGPCRHGHSFGKQARVCYCYCHCYYCYRGSGRSRLVYTYCCWSLADDVLSDAETTSPLLQTMQQSITRLGASDVHDAVFGAILFFGDGESIDYIFFSFVLSTDMTHSFFNGCYFSQTYKLKC